MRESVSVMSDDIKDMAHTEALLTTKTTKITTISYSNARKYFK